MEYIYTKDKLGTDTQTLSMHNAFPDALIVHEIASSARSQLDRLISSTAQPGDRVIVVSLKSFSENLTDIEKILYICANRKITIVSCHGSRPLSIMTAFGSVLAQRETSSTRLSAPNSKLTPEQWEQVVEMRHKQRLKISEIARIMDISEASISRYLAGKQHKNRNNY